MISFTETDTNLPNVVRESKLFNLVTKNRFHVYGLRQINNPTILIEYRKDIVDVNFEQQLDSLVQFFKLNEIEVETFDESDNRRVDIGLRLDLRKFVNKNKKPILAATILSTIVYALEGRIDSEQMKKHRVSDIPKLKPKSNNA